MLIKDRMTRHVEVVSSNDTVREAAQKMKALNIGVLPVCDSRHLVGIITDRDITLRSVADAKDPSSTRVGDVMTRGIEWVLDDQDAKEVAKKMKEKQIRRVPVISHDKKLVGMLSLGDLAVRGEKKTACDVLEKVSAHA